jgi:hypothetical protein
MTLAPRGFSAMGGTVAGTDSVGTIKVAAFFAEIVDTLGELIEERPKIEFTNSGSPAVAGIVGAQFNPSDIVTTSDYEITILHNTNKPVPWGLLETIVITLPKRGTDATAATKTFMGFLTKSGVAMPLKDKMTQKCTVTVSGLVTHTPSA